MTRVLWISNETPDRHGQGGQRRQYFQIKSLIERGHSVHVLTLSGPHDDSSLRAIAAVERLKPRLAGRLPNFQYVVRPFFAARSGRWDKIVIAHVESWRLLRGHSAHIDQAILVDVHNVFSRWYRRRGDNKKSEIWRAREDEILRSVNAVAVCSSAERDALQDRPSCERLLVPHGVDPDEWRCDPPTMTNPTVALFGNWWWEPNAWGLDWFVTEVWRRVRMGNHEAELQIAGEGVPAALAHEPRVTVHGRVRELAPFLAQSRIVAVPVRLGVGAPVKFAEAMASGAPVVASTDAAPWANIEGSCVSDDPDEWVDWISSLLANPRLARNIGQECRSTAVKNLRWDVVCQPLHAWIET
jgi:polysaccharide biosynthesis protein PslH